MLNDVWNHTHALAFLGRNDTVLGAAELHTPNGLGFQRCHAAMLVPIHLAAIKHRMEEQTRFHLKSLPRVSQRKVLHDAHETV
jgi:hypothetical protein